MRAILSILLSASISFAAEPTRPHIVFVLADDLGPGDLGCYGGKIAPTPNIDRMAAEGIRFTRYYSAAPICSPSRCGLITGQYPARWRINSFLQTQAGNAGCEQANYLDSKAPSLPREMKAAGYRTAHFGKWHLGGGRDVADAPKFAAYGYDEHASTWESPEPHPDITASNWVWSDKDKVKRWQRSGFFVDKTLDFLKRHKDGPCFVNCWLDDPHTPWVPNAAAGKGANTKGNLREVMIEVDRQIGRLLEGLKTLGIENETLVIFTSDNGPMPAFGHDRTVGLRGSKMSLYEGGVRLPFIVRKPGAVPANRVDDTTLLSGLDMLPSLHALSGKALPTSIVPDGEDRSAALLGTPMKERVKPLFWEYGRNDRYFKYPSVKGDRSPNMAILRGSWKLLASADGQTTELYNLTIDPNETTNLADDPKYAKEREALATELAKLAVLRNEPRLPRDNLLLYRKPDGTSGTVATPVDWAKRKAEIHRGMEEVMGTLPGQEKRSPLDLKVEEETDCGKYIRRLVSYSSEPGGRVPAYLLIPKSVLDSKQKVPAILCLHPTNNVVGHGTVVGLDAKKNSPYAVELAERGYVTLVPSYPLLAKYQPDIKKLGWQSGTLKAVWDNIRALDLLESLPNVDGKKLGAIGHSLGGHNSVYTAAFDERLQVVVSCCGLDSFLDYQHNKAENWLPEKGWCQTRYMPKLVHYKGRLDAIPFDFHEVVASIAPRQVLIIAPTGDTNFQAASVDRIAAAAKPIYQLLGHPDRLRVEHPVGGHDFTPEMREVAYKLFDSAFEKK